MRQSRNHFSSEILSFSSRYYTVNIPYILKPTPVQSRDGGQKRFCIVSARHCKNVTPAQIRDLYNSPIPDHSRGMRITDKHVEQRLAKDPDSVLLGFFDGELTRPVSMINIAKLRLTNLSDGYVPTTHQELTGDDSFKTTDPVNGNVWFCPWAVSSKNAQGLGLMWGGTWRSIGRLQVLATAALAIQHGGLDRLIAYSRPGDLLSTFLKKAKDHCEINSSRSLSIDGKRLIRDKLGILFPVATDEATTAEYLIRIEDLWTSDKTFMFHSGNGAEFRPGLVFPYGQQCDFASLFYRTGLEYSMDKVRALFRDADPLFEQVA